MPAEAIIQAFAEALEEHQHSAQEVEPHTSRPTLQLVFRHECLCAL
jgi:hypothetical protein